jgi:hypothetical protein
MFVKLLRAVGRRIIGNRIFSHLRLTDYYPEGEMPCSAAEIRAHAAAIESRMFVAAFGSPER